VHGRDYPRGKTAALPKSCEKDAAHARMLRAMHMRPREREVPYIDEDHLDVEFAFRRSLRDIPVQEREALLLRLFNPVNHDLVSLVSPRWQGYTPLGSLRSSAVDLLSDCSKAPVSHTSAAVQTRRSNSTAGGEVLTRRKAKARRCRRTSTRVPRSRRARKKREKTANSKADAGSAAIQTKKAPGRPGEEPPCKSDQTPSLTAASPQSSLTGEDQRAEPKARQAERFTFGSVPHAPRP